MLDDEQAERCEAAQEELHDVLAKYEVTLGIDIVTLGSPFVYLIPNEELDDKPRLH